MSVVITITSNAQDMLRRIAAFNAEVPKDIARAMDTENQETIGHIRIARMTGKGPFPPSEGRLGVVSNRLRNSVRASRAQVLGGVVFSSIGTNIEYAAIHEFGGTVHVRAHTRLNRQTFRRLRDGRVQFAKANSRRAFSSLKRTSFNARTTTIPARAPITRGIQDRQADYSAAVSRAIIQRGNSLGL